MDKLKELFGKNSAKTAEQTAKKRETKEHSRRVRAREKELRHGKDNNKAKKASFSWGSPGQTYDRDARGRGETVLTFNGHTKT